MKKIYTILFIAGIFMHSNAQNINNSEKEKSKVHISGYSQIDYNQDLNKDLRKNGILDVHRLVMLFGYQYNDRTSFITEIEFEHVKEVFVEQAHINYRITNGLSFRGGLILIPMGIINEFHEPPTFNGVERPNVDNTIVPTTWREIGAGFYGNLSNLSLKYQLYLVNGFSSYNNGGLIKGENGLRSGRQKGAKSIISSPNISAKVNYYGIGGLNIGIAGYFGNTQSSMLHGIDKTDQAKLQQADSTVIGVNMIGMDISYLKKGFGIKGQLVFASLNNALEYNTFTGKDLGSKMLGHYIELSYDLFNKFDFNGQKLVPFIRYEKYNTHQDHYDSSLINDLYNRNDLSMGLGWWMSPGAVLKADYQILKSAGNDNSVNRINLGIGIMF
ncbi:hypothetical protein ACFLSY_07885 [Bacteroidota bacterium]